MNAENSNASQSFGAALKEYQRGTIFERCRGLSLRELADVPGCFDGFKTVETYQSHLEEIASLAGESGVLSDDALKRLQDEHCAGLVKKFRNMVPVLNYSLYLTSRRGRYVFDSASGSGLRRAFLNENMQFKAQSPHPDEAIVAERCILAGLSRVQVARYVRICNTKLKKIYSEAMSAISPVAVNDEPMRVPDYDPQPVLPSAPDIVDDSRSRYEVHHDIIADVVNRTLAQSAELKQIQAKYQQVLYALEQPESGPVTPDIETLVEGLVPVVVPRVLELMSSRIMGRHD